MDLKWKLGLVGLIGVGLCVEARADKSVSYEVSLTNITHGVVLTPPIFSLSREEITVFTPGTASSLGLQMLAEGGATDALRDELEVVGVQDVVQMMQPIPPGATVSAVLDGDRKSRLNLASMLLPTNDGFVAMNGPRVFNRKRPMVFYLKSYDAGSEVNDELCANIPGPQCGGEGFNEDGGEGYVVPHAGLHGAGELARERYQWGEPVAVVIVRVVDDSDSDDDDDDDGK